MKRMQDLGWWYWLATVSLLGGGLFGWPWGLCLAMALTIVQIGHVFWITGDVTAFALQVRAAYLAMLVAGLWGPLKWLHWMQLIGTIARVAAGYCFLARSLSLAPWNRRYPLSWDLVKRTYFAAAAAVPPCGAVFRRMSLERV
ncbi:hypothetical protein [Nitrospira moscoviensis]|uniref:Uncharacterized protein n=1 Tax=Nitrospira moscoviensis TaxID=42253 RepID=A0A0K2G7H9_NITMO|nr:hypothetical protein [Nitrospira moscoviensis]ALA56895.1 hypothetical protein NITMOv2_0459 [Nitrospira moscoviensis]